MFLIGVALAIAAMYRRFSEEILSFLPTRIISPVDRLVASETFIELCGETLYAVASSLADEDPHPLTLASALYASANAAEGALALVRAAASSGAGAGAVDVDVAGLDALRRAAAAVRETCALVDVRLD
jgi:hypothetical protein